MIIYSNTVSKFSEDVITGSIVDIIEQNLRDNHIGTSDSERRSWRDSTRSMQLILNGSKIPGDVDVFIEYNVPFTSSRIDFCISGLDEMGKDTAIIIEMKGWGAKGLSKGKGEGTVHADFYGKDVLHPSYQAWSYANYIMNFNSEVVDGQIDVIPCAYLYNLSASSGEVLIEDQSFDYYTSRARVFYSDSGLNFIKFIDSNISKSDDGETMRRIENGKLTVSSSLQKSLKRVLTEKDFFAPMERQVVIHDRLLYEIKKAYNTRRKTVMIVRGGPGTGKSVLALKLLAELNGGYREDGVEKFQHALYVTKTSAPRATYGKELKRLAKDVGAGFLFAGASSFVDCEKNEYPVLLVDEAHRLTNRSSQFSKGKDQVKEIINAAMASVFFIDEDQIVSMSDLGTIDYIKDCAEEQGAIVIDDNLVLETQFRCKGSGLYIAWIDDVLGIRESKDLELLGTLPYDIHIVDSPEELMAAIQSKREEGFVSRIVAGYCWDWASKDNESVKTDIRFAGSDVGLRWNTSTDTWGNDENFCEEIGCIHSSQGLEFQYGGVIIGEDMIYRNGKVITVPEARADQNGTIRGWKKNPEKADRVIRNTYRTLMTRGMYGCYVYCLDKQLGAYLKERLSQFD